MGTRPPTAVGAVAGSVAAASEPGDLGRPFVSICIASGRREHLLRRCLKSVLDQNNPPSFELLLCADDDPAVKSLVDSMFPSGSAVTLLSRGSPARLRNILLARARGELLLFLDDDVELEPHFLARLHHLAVDHPEAGVFGGPNVTPRGSSVFQVTQGAVLASLAATGPVRRRYGRHHPTLADERWFTLCNLAIRREVMVEFDPGLVCAEENAVLGELHRRRVPMVYDPDLAAYHERRPTWRSFAAQMLKYGRGRGQLLARRPRLVRPAFVVPSLLVLYTVLGAPLALWHRAALLPLGLYLLAVAAGAAKVARSVRRVSVAPAAAGLIATVHGCYGVGVLLGVVETAVQLTPSRRAQKARWFNLLRVLVIRQLRIRSKRSLVAIAWPLVGPGFLLALYVFVFRSVFHVPVERYPVYLFAGLLPWTFLVQTLGTAIVSVSTEPELVRRARFPYELLPISTVTTMSLYFLACLVVFVVFLGASGHLVLGVLPALIAPVVALYLLVAALSLMLSLIDVFNRDLRQILANLLTVWFFLVPIVYAQNMLGERLLILRSIDPANMIVGEFRDVLYYGSLSRPAHIVELMVVCIAVYVLALSIFRRFAPLLPKEV